MISKWIEQENKLSREFSFKDFKKALDFTNKIAKIAEELNHHPDILIHNYNKVTITSYTHTNNKVTEKDYQLADQINKEK